MCRPMTPHLNSQGCSTRLLCGDGGRDSLHGAGLCWSIPRGPCVYLFYSMSISASSIIEDLYCRQTMPCNAARLIDSHGRPTRNHGRAISLSNNNVPGLVSGEARTPVHIAADIAGRSEVTLNTSIIICRRPRGSQAASICNVDGAQIHSASDESSCLR